MQRQTLGFPVCSIIEDWWRCIACIRMRDMKKTQEIIKKSDKTRRMEKTREEFAEFSLETNLDDSSFNFMLHQTFALDGMDR